MGRKVKLAVDYFIGRQLEASSLLTRYLAAASFVTAGCWGLFPS